MIGLTSRTTDNTRKVARKATTATFRSLNEAGAVLRKVARNSIKRRKKPSLPGHAPHTRSGKLKNAIRFDVDKPNGSVSIGPVRVSSRKLWELHEHGGTTRPVDASKARKQARDNAKRHEIGGWGPIRKGQIVRRTTRGGSQRTYRYSDKYQRIRLRTPAQVSRADRIVREEAESRATDEARVRRYPARPFMRPALMSQAARLPRHWRNSIRA